MEQTVREEKPTALYAVMFADQRIKVGISGNVPKRMTYYVQEARRNRVTHLTWWACKPFATKAGALRAEGVLCRVMSSAALPSHREWFEGTAEDFSQIIRWTDELRATLGDETGVDRRDIPFLGRHGSWRAEATA